MKDQRVLSKVVADCSRSPFPEWIDGTLPGSRVEVIDGRWRFTNELREAGAYTNAQIDDYQDKKRRDYRWNPPLILTVTARFSHPVDRLRGTGGFGFWNDPFMMTGKGLPARPRAIWFFYASQESAMELALDVPGSGWKAATIDARRLPFLLLAPAAPVAIPLMAAIKPLHRRLWPIGQRAMQVSEALIDCDLTAWHSYTLVWGQKRAVFLVDQRVVLDCDTPPGGPLGFVMWLDSQAMVITPTGRLGHQNLSIPEQQWMEIRELAIEPITP
nr:hypothetical protein [Anaerolineae bacterium]